MKLYGVKDPTGILLDIQPQKSSEYAYWQAAKLGISGKSGDELRKGIDLASVCYRASGLDLNFPSHLASEIAQLMGYRAVEVVVEAIQ